MQTEHNGGYSSKKAKCYGLTKLERCSDYANVQHFFLHREAEVDNTVYPTTTLVSIDCVHIVRAAEDDDVFLTASCYRHALHRLFTSSPGLPEVAIVTSGNFNPTKN